MALTFASMNFVTSKKLILLVGDVLLLYTALYLTLLIRYRGLVSIELWLRHLIPFTIVFVLWITVFFINNLYAVQLVRKNYRFYSYLLQNLIINALIGFTFFYLAPESLTSLRPLRVLIALLFVYAVLFILWRRLFYAMTSSQRLANNLMIIGVNREVIELAQHLLDKPQLGYSLTFITTLGTPLPEPLSGVPHASDLTNLTETIKDHRIQTVVTVHTTNHSADVSRYLFETLTMGLVYYSFPDFYELVTGKIPVASLEKEWFLENLPEGSKHLYEFFKRFLDVLLSLIFGIASLPLIPLIALAIKLDSPGPLVFKQVRTGKGGKVFSAMKFRSMIVGAESQGPQWASKSDVRVTRAGRILRKTRLDEIPQFINIIKGEMSFVGPRPERPEFISLLAKEIPFYNQRLLVKPGLTGWAQINYKYGESVEDALTKLQYDLFYIKNRSLTLDLTIILKTLNTVINASLGQ